MSEFRLQAETSRRVKGLKMPEENSFWFVYILRCSDGSFYTGITKNIEQRLKAHNAGNGAKYTRGRKPVALLFQERHPNLSSARRREEEIKKLERRNKEKLVLDFPRFSAASSGIKRPGARKFR